MQSNSQKSNPRSNFFAPKTEFLSEILTDTVHAIRTKLNDTIRENQNYCYRNTQLFDKINDNLIDFDKVICDLRSIQETQIVNSWKYKFSFGEANIEKRFNKQIAYLRKQYTKTSSFKHGLSNAWEAMAKSDRSGSSEDGLKYDIADSEDSELPETNTGDGGRAAKGKDSGEHKIPKRSSSPELVAAKESDHDRAARHRSYQPLVDGIFKDLKRKALIPKHFEGVGLQLVDKLELISKFLK
jgi:hypothetical protein